jgi:hypothetical protein
MLFVAQENELFAIDWLKKGILIERETSTLPSAAEAVADAKMRARDVARRHPGQEPDTFRVMDATGKIVGVFPKQPLIKNDDLISHHVALSGGQKDRARETVESYLMLDVTVRTKIYLARLDSRVY